MQADQQVMNLVERTWEAVKGDFIGLWLFYEEEVKYAPCETRFGLAMICTARDEEQLKEWHQQVARTWDRPEAFWLLGGYIVPEREEPFAMEPLQR